MKLCPLCNNILIKQQSYTSEPDWYCSKQISFPKDKRSFSHYTECPELNKITFFVDNYRIINEQFTSNIQIHKKYKTIRGRIFKGKTNTFGQFYFKTILSCPSIHLDSEDKLRNRIKLLLLIS